MQRQRLEPSSPKQKDTKVASNHQKQRRGTDSPSNPPEGTDLADILIFNLWPTELQENKPVVLSH